MNKENIIAIVTFVFLFVGVGLFAKACYPVKDNRAKVINNPVKVTIIKDTVYINVINTDSFNKHIDSLEKEIIIKDSIINNLNSDILVKKYKLQRIKEYNRIAGMRNNIKYLRGWINRVLRED